MLVERIQVGRRAENRALPMRKLTLSADGYAPFGTQIQTRHLNDVQPGCILIVLGTFLECLIQL